MNLPRYNGHGPYPGVSLPSSRRSVLAWFGPPVNRFELASYRDGWRCLLTESCFAGGVKPMFWWEIDTLGLRTDDMLHPRESTP